MGYTIASIALILFMLWILYEAWRAPMYRENEDGTFTPLAPPKKLSDLFKSFKK